jgi:hypothetical protein
MLYNDVLCRYFRVIYLREINFSAQAELRELRYEGLWRTAVRKPVKKKPTANIAVDKRFISNWIFKR